LMSLVGGVEGIVNTVRRDIGAAAVKWRAMSRRICDEVFMVRTGPPAIVVGVGVGRRRN